ncbi:O-methyltransferase [Microbacter margulisiae]|uniref:Putative O-methyltransferase YrrM n=1 Tax=Microbacter margulisiae TaxID=1350067 RepID=A0A7W5DQZ5_9PORP|nr:class I SAM-dependent methyltransferase [Microbacter margulisiae]MBB3186939.1 putative O-methyltransferase YrrM [Microbacter margulisiae]
MNYLYTTKEYVCYLLKARHRQGFGIHSPFVFRLLTEVIFVQEYFYCYEPIEALRDTLLENKEKIRVEDFGAGKYTERTIASVAKYSVKSAKYAQLLFRLANMNTSQTILELGTAMGITTSYLASANAHAAVYTIEGDSKLCEYARNHFAQLGKDNINLFSGTIDQHLPKILEIVDKLDFVFFDANHTKEATLRYVMWCLPKIHSGTIFAVDDIHWSPSMKEAWQVLKQDPRVRLSIDLFGMGLLFFNEELIKQDYIVAF